MSVIKVNIDKTVEVSDEQRRQIAALIDGGSGKKRDATREEMKDFIWTHGRGWEAMLGDDFEDDLADATEATRREIEDELEDLL